jgi:signal peptidase II
MSAHSPGHAAVTPGAPTEPPAWRSARAWVIFLAVIVLGVAADLLTKHLAFAHIADRPVAVDLERVLEVKRTLGPSRVQSVVIEQLGGPPPEIVVIPKVLSLTLVLNPGAVFGAGAGGRGFFIVFTVGAMALATLMFALWTSRRDHAAHAGIAMIIAGGLGNMYDRVFYGCVRDFIHPLPGVRWPFGWDPLRNGGELWPYVSNVADKLLILGVIVTAGFLIWRDISERRAARRAREPASPSAEHRHDSAH